MLVLNDITFRIAGRTLLDQTSLSVPAGYRVGLVGLNGTGKSTLFKLIAGELELDSGTMSLIPGIKVGMVRQDLPEDDTTLLEVVLAADTERASLLAQTENLEDPFAIADVYARLDEIDAYNAPARASIILSGLGFDIDLMGLHPQSFGHRGVDGHHVRRVPLAGLADFAVFHQLLQRLQHFHWRLHFHRQRRIGQTD